MNIACFGDIVGSPGREAVGKLLPVLKQEFKIDFFIANGENAAGGAGITPSGASELFRFGVDVITSGDHTWDRREIIEALPQEPQLVRPANYPEGAPGRGYCIVNKGGNKVAVVCLQGRVFMPPTVDNPFTVMRSLLVQIQKETRIIIVDMHAEATSEKVAMGHFLNGQVSAVVGTHTHIQTADEKILSEGTAYITDLGMVGPTDSVIGQRKDKIVERFLTGLPLRFEVATDAVELNGVVIDIDETTGKARSIQRLQRRP